MPEPRKSDELAGAFPGDRNTDLLLRPDPGLFRAVALVAVRDSRRTFGACLGNLVAQGVDVHVLDDGSTDGSREIAEGLLGRGVLAVEAVPRQGVFDHHGLLLRKEELSRQIDADWFLHVDSDEILLPPPGFSSVLETLRAADEEGFDAANLFEFAFVPTREEPDHDHVRFLETMRWYYPFAPTPLHRVSAWKRRAGDVGLAASGGHDVRQPGTRVFPRNLVRRHYLFLSRAHAVEKYSSRTHPIERLGRGWHGWRERLDPARIQLPPRASLRFDDGTAPLEESAPATEHLFLVSGPRSGRAASPAHSKALSPKALFVLGMRGSGASALAGCLLGLGVPLGGPFVQPAPGDDSGGTFEVERVARVHEELLAAFGANPHDASSLPAGWERHPVARELRGKLAPLLDDLFGGLPLWGVEDPRLCLLLPSWLPLLEERGIQPRFVLFVSEPWGVVRSLGRSGVAPPEAAAAWLAHVESAERLTRGLPRIVVRYADLLAAPVEELERIGGALGISWPFPPSCERARIEAFLDAGRRPAEDGPAPPEADRSVPLAFERLERALARACEGAAAEARIDEEVEACHALLDDLGWPERGPRGEATEEAVPPRTAPYNPPRVSTALPPPTPAATAPGRVSRDRLEELEYEARLALEIRRRLEGETRRLEAQLATADAERSHFRAVLAQRESYLAAIHGSVVWRTAQALRRLVGRAW